MTTGARIQRLRQLLVAADLDALLVTELVNVRYLCGFTGSYGALLVTAGGGADALATDGRYTAQAGEQVQGVEVLTLPRPTWISDRVPPAGRVGLEDRTISWARAVQIEGMVGAGRVAAASGLIEQLRQTKDSTEIDALAAAARIGDAAFGELLDWIEPGMTEREVAVRLDRSMVEAGAAAAAFSTIVAAGVKSAMPHHRPDETVLQRGDAVTLDFGALVDGYHSDMTRVVALGSCPDALQRVHQVVSAAQAAGVAAVRPGVQTSAVDAACREVVAAAGFAEQFVHGTGHGIGLQIHEDPFLRPLVSGPAASGPSVTLGEQMAVTVEPGIYLPGVGGIRLEDSLVVTPPGARILTLTPKELVIV